MKWWMKCVHKIKNGCWGDTAESTWWFYGEAASEELIIARALAGQNERNEP